MYLLDRVSSNSLTQLNSPDICPPNCSETVVKCQVALPRPPPPQEN